jgi:hypothetical protein
VAGYRAILSAARGIETLLNRRLEADLPNRRPRAYVVGTNELNALASNGTSDAITPPAITVYIYRITVDAESRTSCLLATKLDGRPRLPVNLHFLITAWDANSDSELEWMGKAIEILQSNASLIGPVLDETGDWHGTESVQIVPDEVSLESMSEAFRALTVDFRLSMPYVAKTIRIEGPVEPVDSIVTTVGVGLVASGVGA